MCMQAAAKAAAAAEAAAAEVTSGAGGTNGRPPDVLHQEGPVTRRMSHMQQDQQLGIKSEKGERILLLLSRSW